MTAEARAQLDAAIDRVRRVRSLGGDGLNSDYALPRPDRKGEFNTLSSDANLLADELVAINADIAQAVSNNDRIEAKLTQLFADTNATLNASLLQIATLTAQAEADKARIAAWVEATTPSAETKHAFIGEFSFSVDVTDEFGDIFAMKVEVPWTVIKDIMGKIAARVAAKGG